MASFKPNDEIIWDAIYKKFFDNYGTKRFPADPWKLLSHNDFYDEETDTELILAYPWHNYDIEELQAEMEREYEWIVNLLQKLES